MTDGPEKGSDSLDNIRERGNYEKAKYAAERIRQVKEGNGFDNTATEVRTDPVLRGIQDVAISTKIAISSAVRALEYAETTLRETELAEAAAKKVSESVSDVKAQRKHIESAEKKLTKSLETMKKVRDELDATLRGKR
jgi:hypothetical protein